MKSIQKSTEFTRLSKEAGYSERACYQRKLASMMSSSSFSTHAGCIRHQTCAACRPCMLDFMLSFFFVYFCAALPGCALGRV